MNYYRFDITTKSGEQLEVLQKAPVDITDALHTVFGNHNIANFRQISKSTFYRVQREDAKAFWDNLEKKMFEDSTE